MGVGVRVGVPGIGVAVGSGVSVAVGVMDGVAVGVAASAWARETGIHRGAKLPFDKERFNWIPGTPILITDNTPFTHW
jgi:hypothetical protein